VTRGYVEIDIFMHIKVKKIGCTFKISVPMHIDISTEI